MIDIYKYINKMNQERYWSRKKDKRRSIKTTLRLKPTGIHEKLTKLIFAIYYLQMQNGKLFGFRNLIFDGMFLMMQILLFCLE